MNSTPCRIRAAESGDVGVILALITELAEYEHLADQVVASEERLSASLFGESPSAEVLFAEVGAETNAGVAGFALYFQNYSTFLAKPGIFLEDLYVRPDYRGSGIGLALLKALAGIAVERDCERLDWMVLDWNKTAIDFYEKLGARRVDTFCPYRLGGEALRTFAGS